MKENKENTETTARESSEVKSSRVDNSTVMFRVGDAWIDREALKNFDLPSIDGMSNKKPKQLQGLLLGKVVDRYLNVRNNLEEISDIISTDDEMLLAFFVSLFHSSSSGRVQTLLDAAADEWADPDDEGDEKDFTKAGRKVKKNWDKVAGILEQFEGENHRRGWMRIAA